MLAKMVSLIKKLGNNKKYAVLAGTVLAVAATAIIALPLMSKNAPEEEDDQIQQSEFFEASAYSSLQNSITENNLVKSYALFVDGEFVAVCEDSEVVEEAVETVKNLSAAFYGAEAEDAQIVNSIEITEGYYNQESVSDGENLLEILGVEENTINTEGLKLDLSYSVTESEEVTVPFETLYLDANYKAATYQKTLQDGQDGTKLVNYNVTYINGNASVKEVESEQIIEEQKPAIVERGTGKSSIKTSASLKLFSLPYIGNISSGFGWRTLWGAPDNHDGLDIVHPINGYSCYGDSIMAAGDGEVVVASYSGGYGNYVVIQHANGMQTGYAHMSAIGVVVGQSVKTGEVIGKIGSTGKSTGPHLHFEVIVSGQKMDPMMFLKDTQLLG